MARLKEHDEHCRQIAHRLEDIADGNLFICESCGEELHEHDFTDKCPRCGAGEDEIRTLSVYDWLEDVLDIDVLCTLRGEYKAAKILVAFGGPNIYVDTWAREVNLYWWNESGSWSFSIEAANEIDEAVSELFSCNR